MKHLMICLSILAAAAVVGCASHKTVAPSTLPSGSFARLWGATLDVPFGDVVKELHLRDDTLFVYSRDNTVYVLSRITGQLLHICQPVPTGARLRAPVLLADKIVYPSDSTLAVYDRRGKMQRTIKLPFPISSNAVGYANEIYLGADNPNSGRFASVNLDSKYVPLHWEAYTYTTVLATPAFQQGAIYAGTTDGRVFAMTTAKASIWPFPNGFHLAPGARILGDIKADESGVFVAGTDGKLLCLDRGNGKVKWQYFAPSALMTGPSISLTAVYQYVDGAGLVALDKFNGAYNRTPRWINADAQQLLAEDDKYAYVRLKNNQLAALDRLTGELRFVNARTDLVAFAPNPRDIVVFAATKDGELLAIRPVLKPGAIGEVAWETTPIDLLAAAQ